MNIEQRFAHLERSNRRLRTGLVTLTIAITTVLIVGQAKPEKVPDVIEAKEFQVVDDNGKALVRISAPLGWGAVSTLNGKGQVLVGLSMSGSGKGVVTTTNGKGKKLVELGGWKDDEPHKGGGVVVTLSGDGRVTGTLGTD